jgi:hypothetical protein
VGQEVRERRGSGGVAVGTVTNKFMTLCPSNIMADEKHSSSHILHGTVNGYLISTPIY